MLIKRSGANFTFLDSFTFTVLHAFRWITRLSLMGGTLSDSAWRGVLSHGVFHDRQAPGKPGGIGHSYPVLLTCRSIVTLCLPGE